MTRAAVLMVAAIFSSQASYANCVFNCRPTDESARAVLENLLARKFKAPFSILSFETTRTADFDLIAGEMRGFEIFFKAVVEFPKGANLDCAPDAGARRAEDCSDDSYFSLIRETRPKPGRQFIEPGGKRIFDEDFRFAELKGRWKGPDGNFY